MMNSFFNQIGKHNYLLAVAADYPVDTSRPVFDINDVVGLVELIKREILVSVKLSQS